jgi:hypothetical protein
MNGKYYPAKRNVLKYGAILTPIYHGMVVTTRQAVEQFATVLGRLFYRSLHGGDDSPGRRFAGPPSLRLKPQRGLKKRKNPYSFVFSSFFNFPRPSMRRREGQNKRSDVRGESSPTSDLRLLRALQLLNQQLLTTFHYSNHMQYGYLNACLISLLFY